MPKNHPRQSMQVVAYLEALAGNIRRLRMKGNLSQIDLAKKAKVGRGVVQAVEQKRRISIEQLIKIAIALGVEPPDLFLSGEEREEITFKFKLLMDKFSDKIPELKEIKK